MSKREVPDFKSIEEMAEFFANTDTSELDLGDVESVDYEPKRIAVSVRIDPDGMIGLSRLARKYGMDRSTLIRFMVKAYLRNSQSRDEAAASISLSHLAGAGRTSRNT